MVFRQISNLFRKLALRRRKKKEEQLRLQMEADGALSFRKLEKRQVLSATFSLDTAANTLTLDGFTTADSLTISDSGATNLAFTLGGGEVWAAAAADAAIAGTGTATITIAAADVVDFVVDDSLGKDMAVSFGATDLSASKTVTLSSGVGAVSQSGTLLGPTLGTALLSIDGSSITLTDSANDFDNLSLTSTGNVDIADVDDLNLAGASITGNLDVLAKGAIDDSAKLDIIGDASFITNNDGAGTGTITLNTATNDFGSITAETFKLDGTTAVDSDIDINDTGPTVVDKLTTDGDVTIDSTGAISDSTGATMTIGGDASFISDSTIVLANEATDALSVTGKATFDTTTGEDDIDVGVDGAGAASAATANFGTLNFNSDADNDTSTSGQVRIAEDSIMQLAGTNEGGAVELTSSSDAHLVDLDAHSLVVTAAGVIDEAGPLTITNNAHFITRHDTPGTGTVTLVDAGNTFGSLSIETLSADGLSKVDTDISYTAPGAIALDTIRTAGELSIDAVGAITDVAGADIDVSQLATFTSDSTIALGDNGTDNLEVGGLATFDTTDSESKIDVGVVTATGVASAGNVALGTLTFNSDANDATADSGQVRIAEDDQMDVAGTNEGGVVELTGGAIVNAGEIDAETLTVTATGNIAQVIGTTINSNGAATFTSAANIDLAVDATDTLTVTGVATFDTTTGEGSIDVGVDAGGAATAATANFGSLNFNSDADNDTSNSGQVRIAEDSDMQLTGTSEAGDAELTSVVGAVHLDTLTTDSLAVIADGAIDQTGVVTVTNAASFTTQHDTDGTGTITLTNTSNALGSITAETLNDAGAAAVDSDISINDSGATVIDKLTTDGDVTIDSKGAISDSTGATMTIAGDANFISDSTITLADEATGTLSVTGKATFDTTTGEGDIDVGVTGAGAAADATANFGTLTFNSDNNDATADSGRVRIAEDSEMDMTGLNEGGEVQLTSTAAAHLIDLDAESLAVTAAGPIDQTGPLTIANNASFTTLHDTPGTGTVTLNDAGNSFGSISIETLSANGLLKVDTDIDITGMSAAVLNTIRTAGELNVDVTGAISDVDGANIDVDQTATFTSNSTITLGDNAADNLEVDGLTTFDTTDGESDIDVGVTGGGVASAGNVALGSLTFNSDANNMTADSGQVRIAEDDQMDVVGTNEGGIVELTGGAAVNLGDIDAETLTVTATGDLDQTAGTTVNSNSDATFTSAANIELAADATDTLSVTGTASFTTSTEGSIDVGVIPSGGSAGDPSTASVAFGKLSFNSDDDNDTSNSGQVRIAEVGDMQLTGTSEAGATELTSVGGAVHLDTLTADSLTVTADGAIDQTGVVTVTDAASFTTQHDTAGTGTITLTNAGNALGRITAETLNKAGAAAVDSDITINDTGATVIDKLTTDGDVTIDSTGAISDSTGATMTIGGDANFLSDSTITLANEATDTLSVTGKASFDTTTGEGNIDVGVDGAGDASASATNFGTLNFNSDDNDATVDSGQVRIAEDSEMNLVGVNEGGVTELTGGSTVELTDLKAQTLDVDATGDLTNTDGADISVTGGATFKSQADITLADHATDVLTVTGGATFDTSTNQTKIDVGSTAGATVNFGTLNFDSDDDADADISDAGEVDITEDSSMQLTGSSEGGDVELTSSAEAHLDTLEANTLEVTAATQIDQTGALTVAMADSATFKLDPAGGSVLLARSTADSSLMDNDINGAATFTDVDTDLRLRNTNADATVPVTPATLDNLEIWFTKADVDVTGLTITIMEDLTLVSEDGGADPGSVSGSGIDIDVTGNVMLIADDTISFATGAADKFSADAHSTFHSLNNMSITVGSSGNIAQIELNDISFNSTDSVDIFSATSVTIVQGDRPIPDGTGTAPSGTDYDNTAGSLNLVTSGMIDSAAILFDAVAKAPVLDVSGNASLTAGTTIALGDVAGDSLDFGTLTYTAGGDVAITEDSAMALTGSSSGLETTLTSDTGGVDLDTLTATKLDVDATGTITDADDAAIAVAGDATFTATGDILLADDAPSNDGDGAKDVLTVTGHAAFVSSGGSITVGANVPAKPTVEFGTLSFDTAGKDVSIDETNDMTLMGTSDGADVNLESGGAIALDTLTASKLTVVAQGGAITDATSAKLTVTGDANFDATGDITLANEALDVLSVIGEATFTTEPAQDIAVGTAANSVELGTTKLTDGDVGDVADADNVTISENDDSNLTDTNIAGTLNVTSETGRILQVNGSKLTADTGDMTAAKSIHLNNTSFSNFTGTAGAGEALADLALNAKTITAINNLKALDIGEPMVLFNDNADTTPALNTILETIEDAPTVDHLPFQTAPTGDFAIAVLNDKALTVTSADGTEGHIYVETTAGDVAVTGLVKTKTAAAAKFRVQMVAAGDLTFSVTGSVESESSSGTAIAKTAELAGKAFDAPLLGTQQVVGDGTLDQNVAVNFGTALEAGFSDVILIYADDKIETHGAIVPATNMVTIRADLAGWNIFLGNGVSPKPKLPTAALVLRDPSIQLFADAGETALSAKIDNAFYVITDVPPIAPIRMEAERPDPIIIPIPDVVFDEPINNTNEIEEFDEIRAFVVPELEEEFYVFKLTEDGEIEIKNEEKVQWKYDKEPTDENIKAVIEDFKANADDGLYSVHIKYKSGDVKEIRFRVSSEDVEGTGFIPHSNDVPGLQVAGIDGEAREADEARDSEIWQQWWRDQNPGQDLPVELTIVPAVDDTSDDAATDNVAAADASLGEFVPQSGKQTDTESGETPGEEKIERQAAMLGLLAPVMWLFGRSKKEGSNDSSDKSESTDDSTDPSTTLSFSRRARRRRADKRDAS
jgi:hypothetical protein